LGVRGLGAGPPEQLLEEAVAHAQRALDLLAIQGIAAVPLADPDARNSLIWNAGRETRLRIWVVTPLPVTIGPAVVSVSGQLPASPSARQWDESYRYFRHSQTTDDLFDAFRNQYLALESLLSQMAPPVVRPPNVLSRAWAAVRGVSAASRFEPENAWLRRALLKAHNRVPLTPFIQATPSKAPKKMASALRRVRNAVFHAKRGAPSHIPYEAESRAQVADMLDRIGRMYVALTSQVLGVNFGSGGMTHAGFESMCKALLPQDVHVTDDPSPGKEDDTAVNPLGGKRMVLKSWHDASLDAPFFMAVRGEASAAEVAARVGSVRRIATTHAGNLAMYDTLERPLSLEEVDMLDVVFGIRGFNTQRLRVRYST
jgi:hypothetical protein